MVVGNRDGVVVIAQEKIAEVLTAAQAIAKKEAAILEKLAEGFTTIDIYQFEKLYTGGQ